MADGIFDKAELLEAIRTDCITFFTFYLADELTLEIPDVHQDVWADILEMVEQCNQPGVLLKLKKLFAIPRGHAKSTIAKLAVILFLKYTDFTFVLYASKTSAYAKAALDDIILWLSQPQETELFGAFERISSNASEVLYIYRMFIRKSANEDARTKIIILKGIGADTQVRGLLIRNTRPQIVVADDIEDNSNTTEILQPKLDTWFYGAFMKSFARRSILIFIGNMLNENTLLARASRDPSWNPTVFGCIVRNSITGQLEPLWDGLNTLQGLLDEYRSFRKNGQGATWEAEMMNLTQEAIFKADLSGVIYIPTPMPEDIEAGAIVLDPAYGKNHWNDDSAFTVHVRIKGRRIPCVIDSVVGKLTEEQLFDTFVELSIKWGLSTWIIEADAGQRLLIPYFKLMFFERQINPDVFLLLPVGNTNQVTKAARIIAFKNIVKSGSYGIGEAEESLVIKLADYNPLNTKIHDDYIDSGAYGPIIWDIYGTTIDSQGIKQVAMLAHGDGSGNMTEIQTAIEVARW